MFQIALSMHFALLFRVYISCSEPLKVDHSAFSQVQKGPRDLRLFTIRRQIRLLVNCTLYFSVVKLVKKSVFSQTDFL